MLQTVKIPRSAPLTIQWLLKLWAIFLVIFTLFRVITVLLFKPVEIAVSSLGPSFWLGFKFDAKWISIILLPIILLSARKTLSPFYSELNKKAWSYYLAVASLLVLAFFGADIGNFSYNHTRINASALNFAEDPAISFKMLWQSYPMVWILLGLVIAVLLIARLIRTTHALTTRQNASDDAVYKKRWYLGVLVFMLWSLYGLFSFTPLKWNDAFALNDNFKSYLALNPFQNFFTTLRFRSPSFSDVKVKEYFPIISRYLNLPEENIAARSYERQVEPGSKALESRPNVVLVICESFSMYKSSMSGNPLNTTPFFYSLCKQGIFFNHCFSPTFGTARGVFGLLTGIPDVQLSKFSTRNPEALNQHTIINDFEDYSKYYFLGGSSGFNNFEGLVKNVQGIKIYQDSSFKAKPLNVWGISDKNLFLESSEVLNAEQKPFFAIIQTADNHRPYSIPEEDTDFEKRLVPRDTLSKYGFDSQEEFDAFCYTDYCFKKFIESARSKPYFNNTIFVFIGDHGVEGEASQMYPAPWTVNRLSDEHVPLLFYAPALLQAQNRSEVVSQVDVLPTIAGLVHQSYMNTTLGRDVISNKAAPHAAFIIHHDEGNIGIVTDDYYFVKNLRIKKESLVSIRKDPPVLNKWQEDSVKNSLSELTSAMYETAKWMLLNNKKKTN
jgi:phosphoglycerol transferase MdoB-like AlkP superfamily enzyme